ncbi:Protein-tyrosine phosphatase [Dictyocaulus viviparus]|uniref:Protein-tyrosine phosphatase n=1 Tax=Dictyocaulus viviparus TaxID=29172 RepID=A0A0D8XXU5_DICVI|nr:Protein-tyrosine phosphatase [Dictyocaulus viviparus]
MKSHVTSNRRSHKHIHSLWWSSVERTRMSMYVRKKKSKNVTKQLPLEEDSENIYIRKKRTIRSNCGVRKQTVAPKEGEGITPLATQCINEYVDRVLRIGVEGLKREFRSISSYRCPNDIYKYDAFNQNLNRNRYYDIVCLDATRVHLTHDVPPSTEYIHANWVKFEKHDQTYIMTQAPLENTIGDFWRMIFQETCPTVINLTQQIENEQMKSVLYWPEHGGNFKTYDRMFVNTKKVDHEGEISIYTIEVLPEGCSNSHIVKLIHMVTWPDKGIPPSGRHVLRVLKKLVANSSDRGPVVVHCSAGTGRAGCIVLIDVILGYLFSGRQVDMVELFKQLRNQRASAIHIDIMYAFIAYGVLDYIRAKLPAQFKDKTKGFIQQFKTMQTD